MEETYIKTAAILGVTGYSGEELLRLLVGHRRVEVIYACAKEARSEKIQELYPDLRGLIDLPCPSLDIKKALKADIIFLALPHRTSMRILPELCRQGNGKKIVIDLSGDYRLSTMEVYRKYYGVEHVDRVRLEQTVYGLPEWKRNLIKGSHVVASPGCYATLCILSLLPLLDKGFSFCSPVCLDLKGGATGAGRRAKTNLLFSELNENVQAYSVTKHPHEAEIEAAFKDFGLEPSFDFVPHLLPLNRGILLTAYCSLAKKLDEKVAHRLYAEYYENEPFLKILPRGTLPELRYVLKTNQCHIAVSLRERTGALIITAALDNLQKGAGGQAVQCMNLMCAWDEKEGLLG